MDSRILRTRRLAGTVVLTVSLILLFSAQLMLRRGEKPKPKAA